MWGDVTLHPFFCGQGLVRDDIMGVGVRWANIPRCLPRASRAANLSCILMLSVPVGPCDTAAIAAAVFSSSLSRRTSETALVTRLPSWRTCALGPHVTAL